MGCQGLNPGWPLARQEPPLSCCRAPCRQVFAAGLDCAWSSTWAARRYRGTFFTATRPLRARASVAKQCRVRGARGGERPGLQACGAVIGAVGNLWEAQMRRGCCPMWAPLTPPLASQARVGSPEGPPGSLLLGYMHPGLPTSEPLQGDPHHFEAFGNFP